MDSTQAKFLLQSYRANGADACDPHFAEAIREIEADPELAEWFARELTLDTAIRRKLRAVPVPERLREAILAAQPFEPSSIRRSRLAPLAIAAALSFLATLSALWFFVANTSKDFASYRKRMVENLSGLQLDFTASNLPAIQGWLASKRAVSGYHVPEGLEKLPCIGCKTWTWRGREVALICFSLEDGRAAHLFIVRRAALPDAPSAGEPLVVLQRKWMTASWSEGEYTYLVARRGDEASLKKLLGFKT
jgi:hypothetical protein